MSKILAVFGATGQQGSSVLNNVLDDAELSKTYQLRALTRDTSSAKAAQLRARGVEVTAADAGDRASLDAAMQGAHTVFIMTTPTFGPDAVEAEVATAKRIADAAVAAGAAYLIFSTLPGAASISGGKYRAVTAFDAKAQAEDYIRTLPVRSAFVSLGSFMENFASQTFLAPRRETSGDATTWVLERNNKPGARWPLLAAVRDIGKFVGAVLADPDRFAGETLCCAQAFYSLEEMAALIAKTTGRDVVYREVSDDQFRAALPPPVADLFADAFGFYEECSYFGPGAEEKVAFAAANARGKLMTLEEFFEAHPLQLE